MWGPLIFCAAGALLALKSPGISSYTRYILFRVHGYPVPNIINFHFRGFLLANGRSYARTAAVLYTMNIHNIFVPSQYQYKNPYCTYITVPRKYKFDIN